MERVQQFWNTLAESMIALCSVLWNAVKRDKKNLLWWDCFGLALYRFTRTNLIQSICVRVSSETELTWTKSNRLSSICSIKFDWFGNRTHAKFGVRFGSIEFDFTMPGCTFLQCKTESLTLELKIFLYLNSSSALLYTQKQKNLH